MEIEGQYNKATVTIDNVEETVMSQLYTLLNTPAYETMENIVIMPDCHAGKGCVIGFTAKVKDKLTPALIGVDIGCGVASLSLTEYPHKGIQDFQKFDDHLRKVMPSGFNVHDDPAKNREMVDEDKQSQFLKLAEKVGQRDGKCLESLGTLGGGNHYCEIDRTFEGNQWLTVHTGSRNLGLLVALYHQKKAQQRMEEAGIDVDPDLAYLEHEDDVSEYLDDMILMQAYARINRELILCRLADLDLEEVQLSMMESVHNYYSGYDHIIRKGAIEAYENEPVLIPLNMRDGIVFGKGKGIPEWNYSAPHGAGRTMSRTKARKNLSLNDYRDQMQGIWSSCVSQSTLDEAPDAYKDKDSIIEAIRSSVHIQDIAEPVYNFKA